MDTDLSSQKLPTEDRDQERERMMRTLAIWLDRALEDEQPAEGLTAELISALRNGDPLPPLEGAEAVVRQITSRGAPFAPFARPAVVNGAAGAVVVRDGRPVAVASLLVHNGRISEIDIVFDEKKLRRVRFG